jgi:hypothetical protein
MDAQFLRIEVRQRLGAVAFAPLGHQAKVLQFPYPLPIQLRQIAVQGPPWGSPLDTAQLIQLFRDPVDPAEIQALFHQVIVADGGMSAALAEPAHPDLRKESMMLPQPVPPLGAIARIVTVSNDHSCDLCSTGVRWGS